MTDSDAHVPPTPDAALEEIPPERTPAATDDELQLWRRVRAGILVEGNRADRKAAKRVQERVAAGTFDPDAAAAELLGGSAVGDSGELERNLIETRTRTLMRDLVMAPRLRGVAGASRAARSAGRNVVAYVLTQLVVLMLFVVLFAAGLALARYVGHSVDGWVDRGLELVGVEPGSGADSDG